MWGAYFCIGAYIHRVLIIPILQYFRSVWCQGSYFSVVKLWFTLRASASAVAPDSPIPSCSRLELVRIKWDNEVSNFKTVEKSTLELM